MRIWLTSISLLLLLAACPGRLLAESPLSAAVRNALAGQKADSIGIAIADTESGEFLFAHNPDKLFIPASVAKIVTTYAALKFLGDGYRFPTEVFADRSILKSYLPSRGPGTKEGHIGNLYFRGYGDPGVVDETVWVWAKELYSLGIRSVDNIVVDDTLFIDSPSASGPRPYQAGLGALSVNHNCYAVTIAPGAPGKKAIVAFTPGLGFKTSVLAKASRAKRNAITVQQNPPSYGFKLPGVKVEGVDFNIMNPESVSVAVKGTIKLSSDPITYYYTAPDPALFFATLMKHHLKQVGVSVSGSLLKGETPAEAKEMHVFRSKRISTLLMDLNQYSNNFIAGQLLYAIGQDSAGYFRQENALKRIRELLEQLGISPDSYDLYDGSGLDRRSRMTPAQLVRVLYAGSRDISISPVLINSLSHFGKTGTLKKRVLPPDPDAAALEPMQRALLSIREQGIWGKTGTLDGVSSLAGYAKNSNDRLVAFAILINGGGSKDRASKIEEAVLRAIVSNGVEETPALHRSQPPESE